MQIQPDQNSFYQTDAAVVAAALEKHPHPAVLSEVKLGHPQQLVYWTEYLLMKDSNGVHYFHNLFLHPAGVVSATPNYFLAFKVRNHAVVFTSHTSGRFENFPAFLNTRKLLPVSSETR